MRRRQLHGFAVALLPFPLACTQTRFATSSSSTPPANVSAAAAAPSPTSAGASLPAVRPVAAASTEVSSTKRRPSQAGFQAGPKERRTTTPGKTKRTVAGAATDASGREIKVRKRDPWGIQQLRDSWSEDAMTKRETENLSERIHREYRYHPDEKRRYYIKFTALLTMPLIVLSWGLSYFYSTGKPPWQADPQHLLNLIRVADTSPRSKLYLYKLDETSALPEHVQRYRAAHKGEKERAERVFKVTHSAFARPTDDDLRRLEMEMEMEEAGEDLEA